MVNSSMKQEVLLSIVVPVYNVQEHLRECLNSLLAQDVDDSQYEIVCINDGSKDLSGDILDEYQKKDKKIKVLHTENGGVSSARNKGIDLANGKYIWFVDSDDMIRENCLQLILELLKTHEPSAIQIKEIASVSVEWEPLQSKDYFIAEHSIGFHGGAWATIINLNIVKENNLSFDEELSIGEDNLFHLSYYLNSSGNTICIKDECYFYRQREGSAMTTILPNKRVKNNLRLAIKMKELIDNISWNDKVLAQSLNRKQINNLYYSAIWRILYALPKSDYNYKEVFNILKSKRIKLPPFWGMSIPGKNFKAKIKRFFSRMYSIKPFYFIYFKFANYVYTKKRNDKKS